MGWRRGHSAKRSSDPEVDKPEVKVQVRDLVRVVGVSIAGKFVLSSPRGEPGKVQGRDRVGTVEELGYFCSLCPTGVGENSFYTVPQGYRARGVSIRGKFVLSRNPGYKSRGSPCG